MSIELKVKIKRYIFLCLSIGVAALIFWFSHQPAVQSSDDSRSFILTLMDIIPHFAEMSEPEKFAIIGHIHSFVRKTAHFSIYAFLGVFVVNCILTYTNTKKKALIYSAALCFFYACSDELHQLFIPGRSGEVRDVIIDFCGSLTGIFIVFIIMMLIEKIKRRYKK